MSAADLHLAVARATGEAPPPPWPEPDMAVLRLHRRRPPDLPLAVFGSAWAEFIAQAADAAACPPDYVAAPLLAAASVLIGHARWAQATPGWSEPPHLWAAVVGDSGNGKSPGADALLRDVLPDIENKMLADFPDRLQDWRGTAEYGDAAASDRDRNAATMGRWILHDRPAEVHVRALQREVRLPGLGTAEAIHEAAGVLVEADWLREPPRGAGHRGKAAYAINPRIWEATP